MAAASDLPLDDGRPGTRRRTLPGRTLPVEARIVLIALLAFVVLDAAIFATPLYRGVLAPDSTTGSFERGIARVAAYAPQSSGDVLVLGDSRIFSGLDVARADAAAPGLHFISAAVPGTTPRCWTVLDRIVDPRADRYRAIVVTVDTYADDDSAIGSIDGDDRAFDLRYIALRANARERIAIANSFSDPGTRLEAFFGLALRGPIVRDDVQALARDPLGRIASLHAAPRFDEPSLRHESLAGLAVDFTHDRVVAPASYTPEQSRELAHQILERPRPSPSYARYRREWLGPIVERYARTSVPVLFVRIPTRPAHRAAPPPPSGTLLAFARERGGRLLPQGPYVALERPELFADLDHVNSTGAARFSAQLGRDVARALSDRAYGSVAMASPPSHPKATGVDATPDGRFADVAALALLGPIGTPITFQSYEFALFFAAIVVLFYVLPNAYARKVLLLGASWYFYARWNAWYLAALVALSAIDYTFGLGIARSTGARQRLLLAVGVGANLAFLGTVKYADCATRTLAGALRLPNDPWALHVLVPVGISFHTFQSISYLVDVSRGKARAVRDPVDYALYLAFFPQLLAGPIVRAARFFGELWGWRRPASAAVLRGLGEIAIGLFKKSALADRFAPVADAYFGAIPAHPGAAAAWSGAIAFGLQIYFDFSGYSDIAIGCARVLGFDFPANFHRPYLAWSITEFWRRWHMTLSAWLRDYLYIPLGGNRGGTLATLRNLMLTMLLGGLWHGASWTFVAWGGYHGALLALERALGIGRSHDGRPPARTARIVATLVTVVLVLAGWVLFRAQTFGDAAAVIRALVAGGSGPGLLDGGELAIAALAIGAEIALEVRPRIAAAPRVAAQIVAAVALLFALELAAYPGAAAPFVYFKF